MMDSLQIRSVIQRVAESTGVPMEDILSTNRQPSIVRARDSVAQELRARGLSLKEIGRALGRDHKTVLHALRKERAA